MNKPFRRDQLTWLAYGMLAYFSYMQSSLGPIMPFLREELNLSYTVGGLHVTAFALGMIVSGLIGAQIANRLGRSLTFWGGALGLAASGLLFLFSPNEWVSIPSTFLMGLLASFFLAMIGAILSDHHGENGSIAITESNVVASLGSGIVPFLIGTFQANGLGWRSALYLPIIAVVVVWLVFRQIEMPKPRSVESAGESKAGRLPLAFWGYFVVIVLCVAIEWCIGVWGSDFLYRVVGLDQTFAAATMTWFFVAMFASRFVGSRLTRTMPTNKLLIIALLITLIGFPIFWLSPIAVLNIVGLAIAGFGVANLFPLTYAASLEVAAGQANAAASNMVLAGGIAIVSAPLVMGWIADMLDIKQAFGVVALLIGLAMLMTFITVRISQRSQATSHEPSTAA